LQNTAARLKSKDFPPKKKNSAGYATGGHGRNLVGDAGDVSPSVFSL